MITRVSKHQQAVLFLEQSIIEGRHHLDQIKSGESLRSFMMQANQFHGAVVARAQVTYCRVHFTQVVHVTILQAEVFELRGTG